jgi:serine/threonine protein kinase/WD40 repeat protein
MPRPAFKRVEELFHQAVALGPAERPGFLETACAGDAALRAAVEELLEHDEEGKHTDSFLVSPLARAAEALRSTGFDVGRGDTSAEESPPAVPGYEVLEERGRGGMGVVYKARQVGLDRIVALKMLLPAGAAVPELLARFRTEAEALARLRHPNIVPIYDIGECQGRPFFTMEYVAGPNLAEYLAGRPQDPAASARLVEVLARTMDAVHQAGLIHRDLKPANVLLAPNPKSETRNPKQIQNFQEENPKPAGRGVSDLSDSDLGIVSGFGFRVSDFEPRITDFGLAKDQTAEQKLTRSGVAMGTPSYMAPEQARSRRGAVGPAADVYALGAILYEMLTGRPPFDADTPAETIVQVLHDEPLSPARLRPRLPRDLVTICLKCLEKAPRRRYAGARDLAEDLRRFQAGEPVRARPVGVAERAYRWCRRRPVVAGLLALSGLLAVTFVGTVLVYEARLNEALAKSVAEERQDIVRLHVNLGVAALEREETFEAAIQFTMALDWDEDGGHGRNHRTRIATALRQSPQLLAAQTFDSPVFRETPLAAALSPDGRRLAVAGAAGTVLVADLGTGESRRLVPGRGAAVRRVTFDADSRPLLTEYAGGRLRLWDLSAPEPVRLRELSTHGASFAALSDNGRWLFTLDAGHRGEVREVATGKTLAAPLDVGHGVRMGVVSPDGRRLALVGPDDALAVWDVTAARRLGRPVPVDRAADQLGVSPDAGRVVATGGTRAARLLQVETGQLRSVWCRLDRFMAPGQFSADGRLLLVDDGRGKIRVWNAVTGQEVTHLHQEGGVAWAGYHDAGKQVVTISTGGAVCLWRLPDAPGETGAVRDSERVAAEGAAVDRRQNPIPLQDGPTVSGGRSAAGALRPPRPADRVVEHAVFSPDGRRVLVCESDETLRVWDTATGMPRAPLPRHGGYVRYGAFSPDGGRLLTASDDGTVRLWDAETGEILAPPLRHGRAIERVCFVADGDRACVVQEGGVVCTWDLTPETRTVDELRDLVRTWPADPGGPGPP